MGRYKLSYDAKADLIRIYHYGVFRFGTVQAERYFNELAAKFEYIASNPFQYQIAIELKPGYRRCVHKSDTIYFRVVPGTEMVEIMAIIGRQDIEAMK